MKKDKKNFDQIYQKLKEEDPTNIKRWNEAILPKIILLFPLFIFMITFLIINQEKSIIDLIAFILFGGGLVLGGILINFLLSDK